MDMGLQTLGCVSDQAWREVKNMIWLALNSHRLRDCDARRNFMVGTFVDNMV